MQTQIGEAFVGSGVNAAHINSVLGGKGGPVETAWATALATPRMGYIPFVTVLRPNLPVKPMTLFVNKADLRGPTHEAMTWGPAQAGVATGVIQAVADGLIDPNIVDSLLLIAAVWVSWDADDADLVFENNARAMVGAIEAGLSCQPSLDELMRLRDRASNPFFVR